MSASTANQLSSRDGLREIDVVRVKGISQPVTVYESLRHCTDERRAQFNALLPHYDAAVEAYREYRWDDAIGLFRKALDICPEDGATAYYINRCEFFCENLPPEDWDGVWTDRRT